MVMTLNVLRIKMILLHVNECNDLEYVHDHNDYENVSDRNEVENVNDIITFTLRLSYIVSSYCERVS